MPPSQPHTSDSEREAIEPSAVGEPHLPKWFDPLVTVLDDAIRIPGTNLRFGLDAIIGFFLPGLGDAAGALSTAALVVFALRHGVPAPIVLRMCFNALLDSLLGLLPFVGDAADALFKANRKNLDLLRRYSAQGRATKADLWVVLVAAVALLAALAIPLTLMVWVLVEGLDWATR